MHVAGKHLKHRKGSIDEFILVGLLLAKRACVFKAADLLQENPAATKDFRIEHSRVHVEEHGSAILPFG
ncbi:hypothetical protein CLV67_105123 [Actinoplanes italicus]|uniref:Uncharacterized protein n=1 Tax=Actinoplanes italicus TaxID=113567 RepID=A0A2T0KEY3_9ACTN|nr:hypothetical protein CLV67_105123 [Actinoplanes italicus]